MRLDHEQAAGSDDILRMTADQWARAYRTGWEPKGKILMSPEEHAKLRKTEEHQDFCKRHGVEDTTQPVVVARPLMDIEAAIRAIGPKPPGDFYPDHARSAGLDEPMTAYPTTDRPPMLADWLNEQEGKTPKNGDVIEVPKGYQEKMAKSANDTQVGGSHYKDMKVEPWAAMEAWMTHEEFAGFLKGSAIAYLARVSTKGVEGKGGRQDILKAKHYLEKLLEVVK